MIWLDLDFCQFLPTFCLVSPFPFLPLFLLLSKRLPFIGWSSHGYGLAARVQFYFSFPFRGQVLKVIVWQVLDFDFVHFGPWIFPFINCSQGPSILNTCALWLPTSHFVCFWFPFLSILFVLFQSIFFFFTYKSHNCTTMSRNLLNYK